MSAPAALSSCLATVLFFGFFFLVEFIVYLDAAVYIHGHVCNTEYFTTFKCCLTPNIFFVVPNK